MYGDTPNLGNLLRLQSMVFDGKLSLHQIVRINEETDGKFLHITQKCSQSYGEFQQTKAGDKYYNNVFCVALGACPRETKDFAECVRGRSKYVNKLRESQLNGSPAPNGHIPSCQRLKQNLEKCAVRFSAKVVKKAHDTV